MVSISVPGCIEKESIKCYAGDCVQNRFLMIGTSRSWFECQNRRMWLTKARDMPVFSMVKHLFSTTITLRRAPKSCWNQTCRCDSILFSVDLSMAPSPRQCTCMLWHQIGVDNTKPSSREKRKTKPFTFFVNNNGKKACLRPYWFWNCQEFPGERKYVALHDCMATNAQVGRSYMHGNATRTIWMVWIPIYLPTANVFQRLSPG